MKLKILLLVLVAFGAIVTSGCIFDETKEVEISGDIGYSVGAINQNQTNIQKIQWTTSIGNNGEAIAENVSCEVILHPEVSSRLISLEGNEKYIGDLEPDTWEGFKGNATFDASNISKRDMDEWENMVKVKIIWEENGKKFEEVIPR
ncbi:hypothetical protein [Methanolobus halotolerans]|nr:hypothetical protein [Methanolobus halotolerans]